ncbi:MAG: GNAT family N-acetyltransferase [Pseudomonadota bacterium]
MKIREAGSADIPAIVALLADDERGRERERPGDPAYQRAFTAMKAQSGNVYLVIEMPDGALAGCLQYTLIHGLSRQGAARAQIEGVRVHAAFRGQGLGGRLMQAALERACADGAKLVQFTSDRSRSEAHRFYERLGFAATHLGFKKML